MEDATRLTRCARTVRLAVIAIGLGGATLLFGPPVGSAAGAASAPDSARALAQQAQEEAGRDEHAASVEHAQAAIALDPSLEPELSLLLAHQLTWADRPAEAIPWYRRCVAREPANREARLGLARALSWNGEVDEAEQLYDQLVLEDPADLDARLGAARVRAWNDDPGGAARLYEAAVAADTSSIEARRGLAEAENLRGRHRAAEQLYRDLLARDPYDAQSRVGLARALYWMGESEPALEELGKVDEATAAPLRNEILDDEGTTIDLAGSRWIDRDDQSLDSILLVVTRGFAPGRSFAVEGEVFRANDPQTPEIAGRRLAVGGNFRKDREWALHLRYGVLGVGNNFDSNDPPIDVGEGETRTVEQVKARYFVWDAFVTWTPVDRTRFDLSNARVPILTPRSLARGIRTDVTALGADRSLTDRLVGRAKVAWAAFTDGNNRWSVEGEVEAGAYRLSRARAWVGAGALALWFDETTDRGYYSPERYDALYGTGRVHVPLGSRASVGGDLRLASERENSDDRFGVFSFGVEGHVGLGAGIGLTAFGRKSTSRFNTSAGYERDGWGVALSRSQ